MKRVLITGANGFIGRQCLPLLLKKDYEIHAVSTKNLTDSTKNINWHQANLLDLNQCKQLIDKIKPSHLLHFAWITTPGKYWTSVENFNWVQATLELLKAFKKNQGERIVIAGTCAEYDWRYGLCSEDITPALPATVYGTCKNSLQLMLNAFSKETDISSAWGRVFFAYGPYEHPDRLISSVINALLNKKKISCSHGNQIRDFLYVKDVAEAFVHLLESDEKGAFNIASGQPLTLKMAINNIAQKLNGESLIEFGNFSDSKNDPPVLIADINKLSNILKWKPKYSLDEGINNTIEWWKIYNSRVNNE